MRTHPKSFIPAILLLSSLGLTTKAYAGPETQDLEPATEVSTTTVPINPELDAQPPVDQEIPWYGLDDLNEIPSSNGEISGLNDLAVVEDDPLRLDQVTNVNQLRDVSPTDWAYEALRSLVDRYGCIVGYPDQTFKGNQALSRYEFAAGLNACLNQIERLIASSEAVLQEDLETINQLMQEFEAELVTIAGRVDSLDARVAFLEDVQFSTTAKLRGFVTFGLTDWFSGDGDTETVLQDEAIMFISSSFTGKDKLEVALLANSFRIPDFDTPNNGINESTREGNLNAAFEDATGGRGNVVQENNFRLSTVEYTFPVIDRENVKSLFTVFANRRFASAGRDIGNEWLGPSKTVSAFAKRNPIFRLGGREGGILRFKFGDKVRFGASYQGNFSNNPDEGQGFFNGNYYIVGQTVITPTDNLAFALTYVNTYTTPGNFKFSRRKFNPNSPGGIGTGLANRFDNEGVFFDENVPVISNAYGFQGFYQVTPMINIGAFATKIDSRIIGRGDADIWSYAGLLTLSDLFKEGNTGGFVVGVEPYLADLDARVDSNENFKNDTSLHIEAYYQHKLNKRISITPSVIWITAPNQNRDNEDIVVGTVQTVFAF
ncbi:putative S-layer protein [Xenococcus sp. PCC 7305]|uniref:iron uptake porin n=1 Tax=Xenococcus sp. PCC 7305 TaxID=102125 RepID=UPI0002AD0BF3|nr:iron uptake porin [Xenococcus sp. PCC 7305]ELS05482.1 putative S-layer protein [Xenococcus sp. PCC 7305]